MTVQTREREPRARDSAWDPFWYGLALWGTLLLAVPILAGFRASTDHSPGSVMMGDAAQATIVALFACPVWSAIRYLFGNRSGLALPSAALTTISAFVVLAAFQWGYKTLATWLGFHYEPLAEHYAGTGWPVWAVLIDVAVVPAVLEETAFRGVIQTGLERAMTSRDALIVQAAMFSVLHFLPAIFVGHFVMGLIFGFVRLRTRSIYPGMVIHCAWNASVLLVSG